MCGFHLSSGCARTPTREVVLRGLVLEQVVPHARELDEISRELMRATTTFVRAPAADGLQAVRKTWMATILHWKAAYALRAGPLLESHALLRSMYWPVRSRKIEELLQDARPINDKLMDELGVDLKGLYAMEYLLFSGDELQTLSRFETSTQARALLEALAHDVAGYATSATATLGDGREFAAQLGEAGQDGLSLVVNQMAESVEIIAQRLALASRDGSRGPLRDTFEANLSGLTFAVSRALLQATESLYLGQTTPGVGSLVKAASEAIDARARAAFTHALASLATLQDSSTNAPHSWPDVFEAAAEALRILEITLKVDVASALGVMLTFSMGDGD